MHYKNLIIKLSVIAAVALLGFFPDSAVGEPLPNPISKKKKILIMTDPGIAPQKKKDTREYLSIFISEVTSLERVQVFGQSQVNKFRAGSLPGDKKKQKKQQQKKRAAKSRNYWNDKARGGGLEEAVFIAVYKYRDKKPNKKDSLRIWSAGLTFGLTIIDLKDGSVKESFETSLSGTGKTRADARQHLKAAFRGRVRALFKKKYLVQSQIISVDFDRVIIQLGEEVGLKRGNWFQIRKPSYLETIGELEYEVPGEPVALARIDKVNKGANEADIMRQWDYIDIKHKAVEISGPPVGWRFSLMGGAFNNRLSGGCYYVTNPLYWFQHSFGFRGGFVQRASLPGYDGLGAVDYHFNFRRPIRRVLRVRPGLGLSLSYIFRDNSTENGGGTAAAFSLPLFLDTEWVLNRNWNLVAGAGWRLFGKASSWSGHPDADGNTPRTRVDGVFLHLAMEYIRF